jgi:hypothetical protein
VAADQIPGGQQKDVIDTLWAFKSKKSAMGMLTQVQSEDLRSRRSTNAWSHVLGHLLSRCELGAGTIWIHPSSNADCHTSLIPSSNTTRGLS